MADTDQHVRRASIAVIKESLAICDSTAVEHIRAAQKAMKRANELSLLLEAIRKNQRTGGTAEAAA